MAKLPSPNEQPIAVNALRTKRAQITGEIEMHSREIDRLRAELVHLDATMQLFDPETDPSDVPALRRYPRRTEWFARGEVTQHIYEAFRECRGRSKFRPLRRRRRQASGYRQSKG